jgi:uncharacterized membrane protein
MGTKRKRSSADEVSSLVHRNIKALLEVRRGYEKAKGFEETLADRVTGFIGSMRFVYFHCAWFSLWLVANLRIIPGLKAFDPFPFSILALSTSIEAIFLATFILISQNRADRLSERHSDLDLQVSLVSEHEISRLSHMVEAVAEHLGARLPTEVEVRKKKAPDVKPEVLIKHIEKAEGELSSK